MTTMHRTLVLNVVGLTSEHLGPSTPNLTQLAKDGSARPLIPVLPAVTCAVQSSFTTGLLPREHGIVANGWYFRDVAEVALWKQSNRLVGGEKLWETARRRDPAFTCAKLFWWYNMYSSADLSVTPRPIYRADGLKLPDIYTDPAPLHAELVAELGAFPLFHFWGPNADIRSTRWIGACAEHLWRTRKPTASLVYLPHLDYNLQRLGPSHPDIQKDLQEVDAVCGKLIAQARADGGRVVVLSEYGITDVRGPIHINRALREAGLLRVRDEQGHETLDAGASEAFAVADHQIAHLYVKRPERVADVQRLVEALPGVELVLDGAGKQHHGLDHPRAGELVAISQADRWFSYYFWLDDRRAPDFARCVDIHRKPGYDPAELFVDPTLLAPKLKVARALLQKALGFRYRMDVIPLDGAQVRGSHGRLTDRLEQGPVFITSERALSREGPVRATEVKSLLLEHVFGQSQALMGAA